MSYIARPCVFARLEAHHRKSMGHSCAWAVQTVFTDNKLGYEVASSLGKYPCMLMKSRGPLFKVQLGQIYTYVDEQSEV